ncbi:MAG: fibronectin type III domain-containing protein [Caldilineaceae bacterium]
MHYLLQLRKLALLVIAALLLQSGFWAMSKTPPVLAQTQSNCSTQLDLPLAECQGLVALYNSTNGAAWRLNAGWLQNNYPCTWATVICVNGHVDVLNMGGNNMQGVIPVEIGNFTSLRQLQLRDNALTGSIPSEIGNLTNLQRLWLDHTQLTGALPSTISNLVNLQWLYADHAHLSGSLPQMASMTSLQVLTLSANQLSGPLPSEIGLMKGIRRLELANNQLSGEISPTLTNLTNLEGSTNSLDLTYNKLTAQDPALLTYLATYQPLWYRSQTIAPSAVQAAANAADSVGVTWTPIAYTQDGGYYEISYATSAPGPFTVAGNTANKSSNTFTITGLAANTTYYVRVRTFTPAHGDQQSDLWSDDSALASVTTPPLPGFSCNNVTEIPATECQALVALFNSTNGLTWTNQTGWGQTNTPCSWFGLTCYQGHVFTIDLRGNHLNGPLPVELVNLTNLDTLILNGNQVNGTLPVALGNLTQLRILWLDTNQLTGPLPAELGNLPQLTNLDLGLNQLSGPIPATFGNLTQLVQLELQGNPLGGSIPAELAKLTNLGRLNLNSTQMTGPVPTWLGDLTQLSVLWLDKNQLTGAIPTELGKLVNLRALDLGLNQLTGPIPGGLGNLTQLTRLELQGNQLSGPLPSELTTLSNVDTLSLAGNQLSGPLPSTLGNMTKLQVLWLQANQFNGLIPPTLTNLVNLTALDLSYNALGANDPTLLTFLNTHQATWAATQTVPPTGLQTGAVTTNTINLTWQPIAYVLDGGYYEVSYATNSAGPYTVAEVTADKTSNSLTLSGLAANTTYYLRVRTLTAAHGYQQSALWSDYSSSISATTAPLAKSATLTIIENTFPHSARNFTFTGGLGRFVLNSATISRRTFTVTTGVYAVNQSPGAGWYLNSIVCDPAAKAVVDLTVNKVTVNVANGDNVVCTFNDWAYVSIQAQVYRDANGNGQPDRGERALSNWAILLYDAYGKFIGKQTTNLNGRANFNQLRVNQYSICEVLQSGWFNTNPRGIDPRYGQPCYTALIGAGFRLTINFGNNTTPPVAGAQVDANDGMTFTPLSDELNQDEDVSAPALNEFIYLPLVER